ILPPKPKAWQFVVHPLAGIPFTSDAITTVNSLCRLTTQEATRPGFFKILPSGVEMEVSHVILQPELNFFEASTVLPAHSSLRQCVFKLVFENNCYLSALPSPGDIVMQWHVPNWKLDVFGLPLILLGPRTFWITVSGQFSNFSDML